MKFLSLAVICLLGLSTYACDTVPSNVANPGDPYSFRGDLNNLGESGQAAQIGNQAAGN